MAERTPEELYVRPCASSFAKF